MTKQVRNEIKCYIHEKQNVREGFKETFKPLIKSQYKVKESIDNQHNSLIEQRKKINLLLLKDLIKTDLLLLKVLIK